MGRVKPAPLAPSRVHSTLLARLSAPGGVVDRARQRATDIGARPYRVFLVWERFSGEHRGEGQELLIARHEILPTPLVDFGSLNRQWFLIGVWPTGTARVTEVPPSYTQDELEGRVLPGGAAVPRKDGEKVTFFYEVVQDGRADDPAQRARFRCGNVPALESDNAQWVLTLERTSGDLGRTGNPVRPGAR